MDVYVLDWKHQKDEPKMQPSCGLKAQVDRGLISLHMTDDLTLPFQVSLHTGATDSPEG